MCPHTKKPDGDNLEKFLNDALNGVVWQDDSHIAWLVRSKTITQEKEGETIVFAKEIDSNTLDYADIVEEIIAQIKIEEERKALLDDH